MDEDTVLSAKLAALRPRLNEQQRRLLLAAAARALGRGGVTRLARVSGVARPTITKALHELEQPPIAPGRVRRVGGGRKKRADRDATLRAELGTLVEPDTRGDPLPPLRWTCTSTRQLAETLTRRGHPISNRAAGALLREAGSGLQANAKAREGRQHPDRDAQFRYLNDRGKAFLARRRPLVRVDTKEEDLVGSCTNGGREWRRQGQPERVNGHDFPDPRVGEAIPSGIDEVGRNAGWGTVGRGHDTASFAVASRRRWWQVVGRAACPQAGRRLIRADGGGRNGARPRLWEGELQGFAEATGRPLPGCQRPPGTSTGPKIAQRLCAHISMNWRGRPLVSHEAVGDLIGATTTRAGLRVQAALAPAVYPPTGHVSDAEPAAVRLTPHAFHGEWHYTSTPAGPPPGT